MVAQRLDAPLIHVVPRPDTPALCQPAVFAARRVERIQPRASEAEGRCPGSQADTTLRPEGAARTLSVTSRRISTLRPQGHPAPLNHGHTTTSGSAIDPVLESLPRRITFRRHAYPCGAAICQKRSNFCPSSNFPWFGQLDPAPNTGKAIQVALPSTTICIDGD